MSELHKSATAIWPMPATAAQTTAYWVDAWQRSILFWDVLRERGNVYTEHSESGKPPVLVFDYDTVLDAREFERPANYALLRIKAPASHPTIAGKRAFVVIDPRAGHGPGIGGFKMDSEIGVALAAGHPCYFVTFFPDPMPGQTIACVARAEAKFLEYVNNQHADAEGGPFVIGNCQGGWALMILAAARPDLVGPILLAGSPVSYWAGVQGKNPMRYSGGLLGGSWLASLTGDLGHGKFDGAHLVTNFEGLNPSNTYWSKLHNLYANVDAERERFLEFERWWGGHFLMNKEEMDWIVQNLFVGNKLARGGVATADGSVQIDLRNIRSPIVVFASWGDNITPPQQALNWIADLYDNVAEIRANDQTIVYCLHEHIGHLGIFVSAGVAKKETAEITSTLDLIDALPSGLYELVIEDTRPDMANLDLIEGRYLSTFHPREVADILALDDGRDDEQAFEVAKRVSEVNQAMYDKFLSPLVKATASEAGAATSRALNPARMERWMVSDANPAMWPVKWMADAVRAQRQPVSEDNPLAQAERAGSKWIEQSLDAYRDARDAMQESLFKAIYESPLLAAALGLPKAAAKQRTPDPERAALVRLKHQEVEAHMEHGTALDAAMRVLIHVGSDGSGIDERPFRLVQAMLKEGGGAKGLTQADVKHSLKMQALVLIVDAERAIAALPRLVPDKATARQVLALVRKITSAKGALSDAREARLAQVAQVLGVDESKPRLKRA
jgi:pimeloyl-ACP methyl ester carboxylesterase